MGGGAEVDVVVVGAGMAGLAAARRLEQAGRKAVVLEREPVPGGRVRSETWEGATIELGAEFVNEHYKRFLPIVEEAGLRDRLEPLESAFRTRVYRDGRWHDFDYQRPTSWLRLQALSRRDRLSVLRFGTRMVARSRGACIGDVAAAPALDGGTLAAAASPGAVRYLLLPIYQTLFGDQADRVSAAFVGAGVRHRAQPRTLRDGLGSVTAALAGRFDVRCGVRVEQVGTGTGHVSVTGRAANGDRVELRARACIVAVPGTQPLALLESPTAAQTDLLGSVTYSSYDLAYVRTRERFDPRDPRGREVYLDFVPPGEHGQSDVLFVLYGFNSAADQGGVLLVGAAPGTGARDMSDDAFAGWVAEHLPKLHPELEGQVTAVRPRRWRDGLPVFPPGRARELSERRHELQRGPIAFAGDYLYAPMVEGAVASGEDAAAAIAG